MEIKISDEQSFSTLHLANIKVIKRDGRLVEFDDQKIYDALAKAKEKIHGTLSPLDQRHLLDIVEKVDQEISERFIDNIKIYEIQNIVEHTLLQYHEYELAEEYIHYRTRRDFQRSQATDINFTIEKLMNKQSSMKMPTKTAMYLIPNVI